MHFLVFLALLQTPNSVTVPNRPTLRLRDIQTTTTPNLTPNSLPEMPYEMILKLGGQGAEIGHLQSDVATLQRLRTDPDRKDIDDLKDTKFRITVWITVLCTVFGTLAAGCGVFGGRVWREMILPRIMNAVVAHMNRERSLQAPVSVDSN